MSQNIQKWLSWGTVSTAFQYLNNTSALWNCCLIPPHGVLKRSRLIFIRCSQNRHSSFSWLEGKSTLIFGSSTLKFSLVLATVVIWLVSGSHSLSVKGYKTVASKAVLNPNQYGHCYQKTRPDHYADENNWCLKILVTPLCWTLNSLRNLFLLIIYFQFIRQEYNSSFGIH